MKAQTQRRLRQLHNRFGLFFAPAILFFAVTGVIQTIGLQDKAPGYVPPAWISLVANLHKKQIVPGAAPARDSRSAAPAVNAGHPEGGKPKKPDAGSIPLKVFVLLLGLVLSISTLLGIWIAFANAATRRTSTILLLAGLLIPLAFILL